MSTRPYDENDSQDAIEKLATMLGREVDEVAHQQFHIWVDAQTSAETCHSNRIRVLSEARGYRTRSYRAPFTDKKLKKIVDTVRAAMLPGEKPTATLTLDAKQIDVLRTALVFGMEAMIHAGDKADGQRDAIGSARANEKWHILHKLFESITPKG